MKEYQYIALREKPELTESAAEWFHSKWGVPGELHLACMKAYPSDETESGRFLCRCG